MTEIIYILRKAHITLIQEKTNKTNTHIYILYTKKHIQKDRDEQLSIFEIFMCFFFRKQFDIYGIICKKKNAKVKQKQKINCKL